MSVVSGIVVGLVAANLLLLSIVTWQRIRLALGERRLRRARQRLKPHVLAFLDGGADLPAALTPYEQAVLARSLDSYAQVLRGPARDRIARYFDQQGTVDRELRRLRVARRSWRRAAAAHRLGDIGPPRAAAGLIRALGDDDRDVRIAAVRSLGRLRSREAASPLVVALAAGRVPALLARWSLLQIGTAALPSLRSLRGSQAAEERASALQLLGLLGDASDSGAVAARLRDSSALVREQAAAALGRLGSSRSIPGLLAALDDRIPAVRAAAATALGRLRDPSSAAPLLARAHADSFDVAQAAARALAATDPAAAQRAAAGNAHLREALDLAALT